MKTMKKLIPVTNYCETACVSLARQYGPLITEKISLKLLIVTTSVLIAVQSFSQSNTVDSVYNASMAFYKAGKFNDAASTFNRIYETKKFGLTTGCLYDGACIYALNGNSDKAFEIIDYLVAVRSYSNYKHITTDSDLRSLYVFSKWQEITAKVKENACKSEEKLKGRIKTELLKARKILAEDDGRLWGIPLPTDNLLVMMGNTIYSLKQIPNSKTNDSVIFFREISGNTLSSTNTVQKYEGEEYATVLAAYLSDSSSTIIHELFHLVQNKHIVLNGLPVNYLDEYDAHEWLRLEYQALRNCINSINRKSGRDTILLFASDAFTYRKIRQTRYKSYLEKETEIETSEGLATYTGYKLSTYPNLFDIAIKEINEREQANTYTRSFAYATGLAYGLIFDYLGLDWRHGLDKVYNFLSIYETLLLKDSLTVRTQGLFEMNERNNFKQIHREEEARKAIVEKNIAYYNDLFFVKPSLSVRLKDSLYGTSYDMNSILVLKEKGIVFPRISGKDGSGKNFGNFKTLPEKEGLGVSGVLNSLTEKKFTFPLPLKVEGNKVIGETYEIELSPGWVMKKVNVKGDMEIIFPGNTQD